MERNEMAPRRRDETAILEYLPRMSPRTYSALMAWVACAYLLLLAVPPQSPPEKMGEYREYMHAATNDPVAAQIEREVAMLMHERDEHKVFFWSWREPYNSLVRSKQAEVCASAGGGQCECV
jgi:hypothetical protein